jgi:hypothetical protein
LLVFWHVGLLDQLEVASKHRMIKIGQLELCHPSRMQGFQDHMDLLRPLPVRLLTQRLLLHDDANLVAG